MDQVTTTDIRELLVATAAFISKQARDISENAPTSHDELLNYYVAIFQQAMRREGANFKRPSKIAAFTSLALYKLAPWGTFSNKAFHSWCRSREFDADESAFALSMVREFAGWEPATAEDYALVIELDRAIIRGARVGARSLVPETFLQWLEKNSEILRDGQVAIDSARRCVRMMREAGDGGSTALAELQHSARIVLREVGRKYGRSGLNSVRRQIGAPPSARRPSNEALGAEFSRDVFALSQHYLGLSASEREAFKEVVSKLDTGSSLSSIVRDNSALLDSTSH